VGPFRAVEAAVGVDSIVVAITKRASMARLRRRRVRR
jgi:hypothetical protein|tara:strand:+ start:402 stop:512 length:111 start_codon:yes stop_codon:yes gene_type:complete